MTEMKLHKCSTPCFFTSCVLPETVEGGCTVGTVQASITAFQPLVARTITVPNSLWSASH